MKDLTDYPLSKRFKATLANFHSYCQQRAEEYPEVQEPRAQSNRSITKYRSIRQLRKLSQGKREEGREGERRREGEGSGVLNIRSSDLIEIIRLKLNSSQPMHLKTEGNEHGKQPHLKRYHNLEFTHFNNKSMELTSQRRKKFNFLVNNSKITLAQNPKTKREKKYEECVVTLQNRPYSANEQPLKYISVEQELVKHKYSQSDLARQKQKFSQTSLHYKKNPPAQPPPSGEKGKDLSGWQMGEEEQLITIQDLQRQSQKRKGKKFQ